MTTIPRLRALLVLLLVGGSLASASELIQRQHSDLASAVAAAESPDHALLLCFVPLYGPLRQQFDRVLADTTVRNGHGRVLHLVMIDPQDDEQLTTDFAISRLPTAILLNRDRVIIDGYIGMPSARSLGLWLTDGWQALAAGSWAGLGHAPPASGPIATELGARDPHQRLSAMQRIAADPHSHLPALIAGLEHEHLAVRVACARQLRRLLPELPAYDAWHKRQQRQTAAATINDWWQQVDHSQLPPPPEGLDGEVLHAALQAIAALNAPEPPIRSAAMTRLVQFGPGVLPLLRAEDEDRDSARLRAMVRWMILIPSAIETRQALRAILTNGSSTERQQAVEALEKLGAEALPILSELLHDGDVLVRESTLRSLGAIGGPEAMAAVASALTSEDSNLRMVAARQLGQTRDNKAAALLAAADITTDDDEMVAVAAIAAIAEAKGTAQAQVLIQSLDDERWRVRAAAAKALGDLRVRSPDAATALTERLEDSDHFVIGESIKALTAIGRPPADERLFPVIERLPGLAPDIAAMLARSGSGRLPSVTALLQRSPPETRAAILHAATKAHSRHNRDQDQPWLRLATSALEDDPDPELREAAASLLRELSPALTSPLLDDLLNDPVDTVRHAAAEAAVVVVAYDWGFSSVRNDNTGPGFGVLSGHVQTTPTARASTLQRVASRLIAGARTPEKQEEEAQTLQEQTQAKHRRWLELLQKHDDDATLSVIARLLCTEGALFTAQAQVLLPRISWPQQRIGYRDHAWRNAIGALLIRSAHDLVVWQLLRADPAACLTMADGLQLLSSTLSTSGPEVAQALRAATTFLTEDEYLITAAASDPGVFAHIVLNNDRHPLYAMNTTEPAARLRRQLIAAEEPWLRVIGYFAAVRADGTPDLITAGLTDPDPRVHRAVLQAMAGPHITDVVRERLAGPLIEAEDLALSLAALQAIIHPALHSTLDITGALRRIEIDDHNIWISSSHRRSGQSVISSAITRRPAFLDSLAERPVPMDTASERLWNLTAMLVLAQYGDNRLIDRIYPLRDQDDAINQALHQALSLTGDERLLPLLQAQFENASDRDELVNLLNTLSGHRSREARRLRRDINRRLQTMPR